MPSFLASRADRDNVGGGTLRSSQQSFVTVETIADGPELVCTVQDQAVNHGFPPHDDARITTGAAHVTIVPMSGPSRTLCRAGSIADCLHVASGSGHVLSVEI